MLDWKPCYFTGIRASIAKEPYIFVFFQGGGGFGPPVPPLDPHMLKPMSIICLTRGMSLIGIGVTWLLSLVYLLILIIKRFLRYSGNQNFKKDYINHGLLLILVF